MERTLNSKALCAALNIDKGQLSRESKRPGFPVDKRSGTKFFNAAEVAAWRAHNIPVRESGSKLQSTANDLVNTDRKVPDVLAAKPLAEKEDQFVKVLMSGKASLVDLLNAAVQLAARQLAQEALAGKLMPQSVDGMRKNVEELSNARGNALELAEREGRLIAREVAKEVIGANNQRLIRICATMQNEWPMFMEDCLSDPNFLNLDIEARKRRGRDWIGNQCRSVLNLEAESIESAIDAARKTDEADGAE